MAQWKDVLQYPGEDSYRLLTNKVTLALTSSNHNIMAIAITLNHHPDSVPHNPWPLVKHNYRPDTNHQFHITDISHPHHDIKMVRWYFQALWLLRLLNQEAGSTFILLYVDDDVLINPWYNLALTIIINVSPWSSCFPWMILSYVKVRWIWGDSNFWLLGGQHQLCWWY